MEREEEDDNFKKEISFPQQSDTEYSSTNSEHPIMIHYNDFLLTSEQKQNSSPVSPTLSSSFISTSSLIYHLILVNSPCVPISTVKRIWRSSHPTSMKLCADGGANRLYDSFYRPRGKKDDAQEEGKEQRREDRREDYLPDAIIGDLDSLRSDVREYYESHGVRIIQDDNQDNNDLNKAIEYLYQKIHPSLVDMPSLTSPTTTISSSSTLSSSATTAVVERVCLKNHGIIIFGGICGIRFDQDMANIDSLYLWMNHFQRILLLDGEKLLFLLLPGRRNIIKPLRTFTPTSPREGLQRGGEGEEEDEKMIYEGKYCGLIPFAQPVNSITTTGLQWNLTNESLKFGYRISSSNTIPKDVYEVTVETSEPLLWTTTWHYQTE